LVKASKLNGKKVVTTNAFVVGEVEAAELDTNTWQITHLHIGLTNEALNQLGFKKPLLGGVTICLPVSYVPAAHDVITPNKSFQELKETKECK
jgi:sporulation protein YlmC with PRC-barrel domain